MSAATKHLVLIGGGHAHVMVVKSLGAKPQPGLHVTLISKEVAAPYSGMLPGFVAGLYDHAECHIDLPRLSRWARAKFIHGTVYGIDRTARTVLIEGRPPLSYDLLSIDVGITPDMSDIAGAAEHAVPVKPVSTFVARWQALRDAARRPDGPRRIVVVGAGAAGYELVLAARHALIHDPIIQSPDDFSFALVGASLLPQHNDRARKLARDALARAGVALVTGRRVSAIEAGAVALDDGTEIPADAVLVSTKAAPAPWLRNSGFPCDAAGFLALRPTLQVLDDEDVFAAGDCATVIDHPREKAGVFAVRQGPPLTNNIRLRASGLPARPFRPQRQFLTLLSEGRRSAIAARGEVAVAGAWAWVWKDHIDRKFMRLFQVEPERGEVAPVE